MIKQQNIINLIDKSITDKIVEVSLTEVIESLNDRINKFSIVVCKDYPNIRLADYDNVKIDSIETGRLRYNICQLRHCAKRIEDIKWMIRNRANFPKFNNKQVFNLILLKEKLQKENAINEKG